MKGFLCIISVFLLFMSDAGCDCGSATGNDCYRESDCPKCQTCQMGECVQKREICDDGLDNDCDGDTDEDCEDLCVGVECMSPPPRECKDGTTLRFYNTPGYCVDGECRYSTTEYTCEQECQNDHCSENFCIGIHCVDDNICTDDGCDTLTGCTYVPNSHDCDDGDRCTPNDVCVNGECQPGDPIDCDDGIDCTDDSCDPAIRCVNNPVHSACDDGNPCTDEVCDTELGCLNPNNSIPCDDADICTMEDICAGGTCRGVPLDSDGDGFIATDCGGNDCDDSDPDTNPDAEEICNGKDNNCDGLADMVGTNLCNYEAFCSNGFLVFCEDVPGPTIAPSVIDETEVWCAKNSPVLADEDLVVIESGVLSIGPCTEIRASDGVFIEISGQLCVDAHPDQPSTFTSSSATPSRGSWGGIKARQYSDAMIRLFAVNIDYAVSGILLEQCGVGCIASIEKCSFRLNEIAVEGFPWSSSERVEVLDSTFIDNTCGSDGGPKTFIGCTFTENDWGVCGGIEVELIECSVSDNVVGLESGMGSITNCIIENNSEVGIATNRDGPVLTGNIISSNKIGVAANYHFGVASFSPAHQNIICNNMEYDILMAASINYDATNNWWCTTDPAEIASRIWDVYDDSNLGQVVYEPFLEQEP